MTAGKPGVKMTFRVAPGSRVRESDAPVLGQIFEQLKKTGLLTAERVLNEASKTGSPMYRYFEWDDHKAAHQFRLTQARALLRSIEVVLEDAKGKKVPMKMYFNVRDSENHRSYEAATFVFDTPDLADQVIEQALAQLEAWKARHAKYGWAKAAMPGIMAAMRAVKASVKKAKTKKK